MIHFGTTSLIRTIENRSMEEEKEAVISQTSFMAAQIMLRGLSAYGSEVDEDASLIAEVESMANQYNGRIIILDRQYKVILDTYKQKTNNYILTPEVISVMTKRNITTAVINEHYLEVMQPLVDTEADEVAGIIITTSSIDRYQSEMDYLYRQQSVLFGIFFLITLAIMLIVVALIKRPFKRIQRSLYSVINGHGEVKLVPSRFVEFSNIATAFNQIHDQYQKLEDTRQEFVSNVSHELKTPITSMKILADSLVMMDEVPVEIYKEFMEDIVHEIDRESQIITDLLELVKMDKTQADLNVEMTNINELLEEILKRIKPIAHERGIQIRLETMRNVMAEVDRGKLSMALTNLIENAVKYNNDNGSVSVSLNADHKFLYIRIKDTGVGIPEDCKDLIFDRFYRVDKARSRDTGGTGLGLSITRNIILLHKGSVKVHSKLGEGSTFIVRIPLNYL